MAVQLKLSRRVARKLSLVISVSGLTALLVVSVICPELMHAFIVVFLVLVALASLLPRLAEEEVSLLDELRKMPVPLGWFNVDATKARLLRKHLVPALQAAEGIAKGQNNTNAIFEHLSELLKGIPKRLEETASRYYPGDTPDQKRAREAWVARMQQIIGWIKATRNLVAHGQYKPSAVEAYTALQATLELLDALKPANEAVLLARCPDDRIVEVKLERGKAKWHAKIEVCRYTQNNQEKIHKQILDYKLLEQHYKLLEERSKTRENAYVERR